MAFCPHTKLYLFLITLIVSFAQFSCSLEVHEAPTSTPVISLEELGFMHICTCTRLAWGTHLALVPLPVGHQGRGWGAPQHCSSYLGTNAAALHLDSGQPVHMLQDILESYFKQA